MSLILPQKLGSTHGPWLIKSCASLGPFGMKRGGQRIHPGLTHPMRQAFYLGGGVCTSTLWQWVCDVKWGFIETFLAISEKSTGVVEKYTIAWLILTCALHFSFREGAVRIFFEEYTHYPLNRASRYTKFCLINLPIWKHYIFLSLSRKLQHPGLMQRQVSNPEAGGFLVTEQYR